MSADSNLSVQLTPASTSTEPSSAKASLQINLQTGQLELDLKGATVSALYAVVFVTAISGLQLGTFSTDASGDGHFETTLGSNTYFGHFSLTREDAAQFVSADVTFTIGITGQLSTTSSTTSTTQVTATAGGTQQIEFQIDPAFRSIEAGKFAKFNILIKQYTGASASVLLAARGVPDSSVAIFTPDMGLASPEFHSTLTVVTSVNTPAQTYGIIVLALVNGQEFTYQLGLEVEQSSTVTTTQTSSTFTVSVGTSLSVTLLASKSQYQANSTVNLQGHVTDHRGGSVADASVSVQVDGPAGAEIVFVTDLRTDGAGIFHVNFKLPANATVGTYTGFATASKAGFNTATTHTTFVVGTSQTPSVVINDVYAADSSGTRSAVFSRGQMVFIWVVVQNSGAPFQGVIWVQVRDPNGTPISILLQISTLNTGQTIRVAFGFTPAVGASTGLYIANALVSDKLISQGGVFLASSDAQFALTG